MQGSETYKKHGNLPALRRQSSEIKEAKIGRIHMPEYWEGERKLFTLNLQLNMLQCLHVRKLPKSRKDYQKETDKHSIPGTHMGTKRVSVPIRQSKTT